MNTRTDPTDDQFRRWATGFVARTSAAVHMNTATTVDPLDQSRELGAILTVALDCLVDNLADPARPADPRGDGPRPAHRRPDRPAHDRAAAGEHRRVPDLRRTRQTLQYPHRQTLALTARRPVPDRRPASEDQVMPA